MLRSFLMYFSKADWARRIVMDWKFAWKVASRFVAGVTIDDAISVVRELNKQGINATLDYLGENTTNIEEAEVARIAILNIIKEIDRTGVEANVSIKLTQIGLSIDANLCEDNLVNILRFAKDHGNFIRIDMEDSQYVDLTLKMYDRMRKSFGLSNTGIVIQSYLYRSSLDIDKLMNEGARVRLCKGAYKESKDIAYPRKRDVDNAFDQLAEMLVKGAIASGSPAISENGKIPPIPAIASHDPARLDHVKEVSQHCLLPKNAIEFQMLYGIRRDLQITTVKQGFPVRVYVPFGTQWYPYFMRRLAERPANLWFFISNYFRN